MWRRLSRMSSSEWWADTVPRRGTGAVSWRLTVWLLLVWVMVFGSIDPLTLLGGVLVAVAVQWAFPLPRIPGRWTLHPWSALVLLGRFAADLVRAGLQVSWVVVSGRKVDNAILRVDLRSSDPVHMTIVSGMTSLVPGSIVVRVDRLVGRIYIHVLDVEGRGGIEAVRRSVLDQEDRILRAFLRPADLRSFGLGGRPGRPGGGVGAPAEGSGRPAEGAGRPPDEDGAERDVEGGED